MDPDTVWVQPPEGYDIFAVSRNPRRVFCYLKISLQCRPKSEIMVLRLWRRIKSFHGWAEFLCGLNTILLLDGHDFNDELRILIYRLGVGTKSRENYFKAIYIYDAISCFSTNKLLDIHAYPTSMNIRGHDNL